MKIKIAILIIMLTICSDSITYSQSSKHESLNYQIYFINNFHTGVLFLTGDIDFRNNMLKIEYAPLEVSNNLERTKGIALEQDRLSIFGSIKGKDALIIEVGRNYEE